MNAIFVMSTPFPYGQAFSCRARNLTKLLCCCGYHVHVVAPESVGKEETDELEGYDYSVSHIYDPKNILTLSGFGTAKPYMAAVDEYADKNDVDLIVSSSMAFVSGHLLKKAKKLEVPYIVEQCEWYDYSTFKGGKWNPYYREHIRCIKKKNKDVYGIIAISRLFEQHYSFMGVPVVRVPTILDVENTRWRERKIDTDDWHIAFAGSLGKGKETMLPIFRAIARLNMDTGNIKDRAGIIFDIYGPKEKDVLNNIGNDVALYEKIKPFVRVHGYISQELVEEKVREADFTIFTRPIRRSSNAGFPTKFAESMAVGTPVITNDTGDISLYLKNGQNGYLLGNGTEDEVLSAFKKILSIDRNTYIAMRKNARKTAEENFDFRKYENGIKELVEEGFLKKL